MTYEASRKKQVLVLQPKGKPLYNDSSSFGLKMLESMGWKKGNGLGKNQHGNLDFIQMRYKNNSNGLGFDGLKDDQWTETESSFDSLLKNLNSQSNSNSGDDADQKRKDKSLEEMSKKSRARVHYKKFTRGKDVYKYSEKDLANILGKKSLKDDENKEEQKEVVADSDKPDTYDSELIVNTGISITEYFKQKKMGKSSEDKSENHTNGFVEEDIDAEISEKKDKIKKRKKKDKSIADGKFEDVCDEETAFNENEINNEIYEEPSIAKSKKKKKKNNKRELIEPVEEEEPLEVPKKKKKSKNEKNKDSDELEKSVDVSTNKSESSNTHLLQTMTNNKNSNDVDRPRGANAVYSPDVILIPSNVAQKMTSVKINDFNNANLGNVIGYGMTDDVEIKVVETKMGDKINNDKYALYNMDRITKPRVNQRKILTKIKKTKKSIQVI